MTKTYSIPPAFFADHRERGCSESAVVVRETRRAITVDLDVVAWMDLRSDCSYFIETAEAGAFDGFNPIGLKRSAAATMRALDADPYTAEEQAAGRIEWARREQEQFEANREARERYHQRAREEQAAREAERLAHPRLRTTYHSAIRNIFGLADDTDLKIGARLVTETLAVYEVTDLGEERRGDIPVTLRTRDGETINGKIELQRRSA